MYTVIGAEILENKISYTLQEVKAQSCFINGELDEKFHVVFMKFDTWIRIFYDDGVLFIRVGFDDELTELDIEETHFDFPIINETEIGAGTDKIINKILTGFTISEAFNLFLEFDNKIKLRIAQEMINQFDFGPTLVEIHE